MPSKFVIKRDSDGRPTEGGLRLPGSDQSEEADQSVQSTTLKARLHQTSKGRITKPSNPVKSRKSHGNASSSRFLVSKGPALQGLNSKRSDEGGLHYMAPLDKNLAREAIPEGQAMPVSQPSIKPKSNESSAFGSSDPSRNRWSKGSYQAKAGDIAANTALPPPPAPDSVHLGITNGHSQSTDALLPGFHDEKNDALYSKSGHEGSQGSHQSKSAPASTVRSPSTEPAAPVGL